jgi:hypothetical protein
MNKKFIIIGSRRRDTQDDFDAIYKLFSSLYEPGDVIISGGCSKGGDRFAEIIARRLGLTEENGKLIIHRPKKPRFPHKWAWAGAMFDRNVIVAREGDWQTIVIACVVDPLDGLDEVLKRKRGGTEDTLKKIVSLKTIKRNNIRLV